MPSSVEPVKNDPTKAEATRLALIEAARLVLVGRGYAGLSTREVASEAGVPVSQIHYHFGSKQGLVLALYRHQDATRQARQRNLYEQSGLLLSEQWQIACDYLDEDIESGYVRVLLEMSAAGWSDPQIAESVRTGFLGWAEILRDLAERAEREFGSFGPLSPIDVATLIGGAFIGSEVFLMLKLEGPEMPIRRALRSIGHAIAELERNALKISQLEQEQLS